MCACVCVCVCGIYDTYDHMHIYIYICYGLHIYICVCILWLIYIYHIIQYYTWYIYMSYYIIYVYMYSGATWGPMKPHSCQENMRQAIQRPMGSRASEVRSHPKSRQIDKRKYAYGMHWSKQICKCFFFEILFCMFSVAGAMASLLMCPSPPKSFLVSFRSLQAFASDGLETCSAQFVAFKWKQGSGGMAYLTSSIYGRLSANNRPYIIVISFNCSINHDRSRYYQNTMS